MTIRCSTTLARSVLAAAVLMVALLPAGTAVATPSHQPADQATGRPGGATRTTLTFTVNDCEGCEVQLANALQTQHTDVQLWSSKTKKVRDGRVRFTVATPKTWGLSVTVRAPWEGNTGYLTTVAWRYNGKLQGDPVTLEEAVTRTKASACWEGVRRSDVTVPLVVEQVEVDGVTGRVPGSIAFVPETQSWLHPMREVQDGVLGSQDVNICH